MKNTLCEMLQSKLPKQEETGRLTCRILACSYEKHMLEEMGDPRTVFWIAQLPNVYVTGTTGLVSRRIRYQQDVDTTIIVAVFRYI